MPPRYSTAEVPVYGPAPGNGSAPQQKKSWRERMQALRYFPALIKLIWSTSPVLSVLMVVLRLARSLTPLFELYIARLIVDTVVASRLHGAEWDHLRSLFLAGIGI